MIRVRGGTFLMGSDDFPPRERPVHLVAADSFPYAPNCDLRYHPSSRQPHDARVARPASA
jgi:hypothetical protein